ncbi:MAG: MBL fold metallo-hydrolase [Defluviitaleaceae bacterium]|nr:MBL fold metallo-hydrolase [Defluviitaleaceae bacterium]
MVKIGNLYMLDVKGPGTNPYNVVLIDNNGELIMVDAGLPSLTDCLKKEIEACGFDISKVEKIIITHQDLDHVGSLKDIKVINPNVEIISHETEAAYIDWSKEPVKLTQRKAGYGQMSDEEKEEFDNFYKTWEGCKIPVDKVTGDNATVGKGDNILLIHIPGHTPGHVCVYVKSEKALITGDAIRGENGTLLGPNPIFTQYMDMAYESLKKLHNLDIEKILCYHGGLVDKDALKQLKELKYEA